MLLCDEPTSALDPLTTKSMLALLTDINKKLGVTIIIITHELSVVQADVYKRQTPVRGLPNTSLRTGCFFRMTCVVPSAYSTVCPQTGWVKAVSYTHLDVYKRQDEQCAAEEPKWREVSGGHYAACHHLDKVK